MTETSAARSGPARPQPGSPDQPEDGGANADQLLYASILSKGMYLGLGLLLLTFALYLLGIVEPGIPVEEIPNYWGLRVDEYLEAVNHDFLHREHVVTGWGWMALLGMGDYLNFIGIALLAAVTIVCYLGILPNLIRRKDWIFSVIAALEVLILALAASGLVSGGGH